MAKNKMPKMGKKNAGSPQMKPISGKKAPSTGDDLAEIARKAANMSNEDMASHRKVSEPGKKKEPKQIPAPNAQKWLEKIKRADKVRDPFVKDYDRFFRMYQGDYNERPNKKRRSGDGMSVNIVYSHVEIVTPSVFSGFPFIKVRAKPRVDEPRAQAEQRARNMELVINYWFKELAVDEELHDVFLDTFFGSAAVELGWETVVEDDEPEVMAPEGTQEEIPQQPVLTLKDRPFIIRRELKSLYLDPDARRRRDCRWIGIEEVIHFNDFIASSAYTDRAKQKVKAQIYPKRDDEKSWLGRDENNSDREWVQIFTIWDKDTKKKYVVCKECPYFLNTDDPAGEDWPYEIEYKSDPFPICIHDAKRDRMSPYTWSEFKAYEPQIQELNRIRAAIQVHVKRSLPKYIYTDSAGKASDINKLMQARSDEAVKLDNLDAFRPLDNADIPKDVYQFNQMSKEDLLNISGLFEYQNQSIADTATEASLIEGRSQVRKTMRSKNWEQFVVEIASKLAQLCQQNMDQAVAIEIAGQKGTEWLQVSKEEIQGEFYFDIEPGIMEYKNESLRKQQLLKFVELTARDMNVNRRALIAKVAQEFDLAPEDFILPEDQLPPPPPPEPQIKFKPIDGLSINDSALLNQFLLAALRQNGVDVGPLVDKVSGASEIGSGGNHGKAAALLGMGPPQGANLPGPKPMAPAAPADATGGKDMADNGANPNGNPALQPVIGNLAEGGMQ